MRKPSQCGYGQCHRGAGHQGLARFGAIRAGNVHSEWLFRFSEWPFQLFAFFSGFGGGLGARVVEAWDCNGACALAGGGPAAGRAVPVPVGHRTLLVTAVERTVPDVTGRAFALFPGRQEIGVRRGPPLRRRRSFYLRSPARLS
ncbi:hypothetical protein [Streptomyces sp. NPDC093149]|uniref:hypothetical protein n=1 Tax=Streptomyces sp. NPDC093149 TaxID=3366031 RepID=UPI003824C236